MPSPEDEFYVDASVLVDEWEETHPDTEKTVLEIDDVIVTLEHKNVTD